MDIETTYSVAGTSGVKTHAAKQKKKIVSSKKENPDKAAISAGPSKGKKKTMLDLVCEAIKVSGEDKKGASVQAIKKYVKSQQDFEAANFNTMVNRALMKGVEKGTLQRPPKSKDATGATGYFRLAKVEVPKRTTKTTKKQKTDEHASDSEVNVKPAKPRKRNLSDTYIEEMRGTVTSTPKPLVKQIATSKDVKNTKKVLPKKKAGDVETSDTKIVMKKTELQSMKSYSSDTEVDFKKKNAKSTKDVLKKGKSDKSKTEKAESPSKASKAKAKKLYNSADGKENEIKSKLGKTKSKKQP